MNDAMPEFRQDIAWASQAACLLEATAPKVGNVNRHHDFADCSLEDFLLSALAIGPAMGRVHRQSLGETVFQAISATRQVVSANTNLGMVLLMVPLAKAWAQMGNAANPSRSPAWADMKEPIRQLLASLGVEDARWVYRAIRLASPSGMGEVEAADVYADQEPDISLVQAMKLAAHRDLIAQEYTTGLGITLDVAIPALREALGQGLSLPLAIAQAHLFLMSRYPDSLIARKAGPEASQAAQRWAARAWQAGGFASDRGQQAVAWLDQKLREEGNRLNPGTTADLIAAALLGLLLEKGPRLWRQYRSTLKAKEVKNDASSLTSS